MIKNNNSTSLIFFSAIFILGIYLRIYQINFDDYWFDEYASFWVADPQLSLQETLQRSNNIDRGTNLIFNLLLKYFFKIFYYDPEVGRFLPLFFGILSIPLLTYLSYQFDKRPSYLFTTFLISINWYLISYSQETRPYMLSFFLSILSIIFFLKILEEKIDGKNKFIFAIFYVLFSFFAASNHIFFFIVILSQIFFLLIEYYFNQKKIIFPVFNIFLVFILYIIFMYDALIQQLSIKNFWIQQIELDFFINYYFSRFFGSKIMGLIYLLTIIFLIFKLKNKFFDNSKRFLFLLILLISSYIFPLIYGFISKPILTDRYIIFVLIPIILIVSIFTLSLKNTKIKNSILAIIILSTLGNNYLEIFERKHTKPEFNKVLEKISETNFDYIYLKTPTEDHKNLLINYLKLTKNFKRKNFNILNEGEILNKKSIWQICYQPINDFNCSKDQTLKKFSEVRKIKFHLIEATLYSL